jgi:hypothetical protein
VKTADLLSDIASVAGALGGLAGFSALIIALLRDRNRRRIPPAELRQLLHDLEDAFTDIITSPEGRPPAWFDDAQRKRNGQMLASYAGLLVDDDLNSRVGQARLAYMDCLTLARIVGRGDPSQQIEQAEHGRAATSRAIDRMNELRRTYGTPGS